jgi:hypothetical protein
VFTIAYCCWGALIVGLYFLIPPHKQ